MVTPLLVFLVGGPEMVCEQWPQWDLSFTFQWQSFVASYPSEGPDHDLSVPPVDSQGWRLAGLSSNSIFRLPWPGRPSFCSVDRTPDPEHMQVTLSPPYSLSFTLHFWDQDLPGQTGSPVCSLNTLCLPFVAVPAVGNYIFRYDLSMYSL